MAEHFITLLMHTQLWSTEHYRPQGLDTQSQDKISM